MEAGRVGISDGLGRLCFTIETIREQSGWKVRVRSFVQAVRSLDHNCQDEDAARFVAAGFVRQFPQIIQRVEQGLEPDWYESA